jgi:hypothetical protein
MMDAIQELKTRAEILHRRMQADNPTAEIQRADCLNQIAKELGFASWTAAKNAISGEKPVEDFGTLLYPRRGGALNSWFKTYEEAHEARALRGGYLLAYRRQFFVVDVAHVEVLGLDPADPDWDAMGFDWVRPRDFAARSRLYAKLVHRLPRVSLK